MDITSKERLIFDEKIALVTVTYNSANLAYDFAEFARNFKSVIVVDNHSDDASVDEYRSRLNNARVIALGENIGFGRANNAGLKLASDLGARYALLINPDCSLDAPSVLSLMEAMEGNPNVAVLNPRIVDSSGTTNPLVCFDFNRPYQQKKVGSKVLNEPDSIDVILDVVIDGSCMLFNLRAFERVGFFSEELFLFSEEDDVSIRLNRVGYRTAASNRAIATHLGASSSSPSFRLSCLRAYHRRWSRFWMTSQYVSSTRRFVEAALVLAAAPFALVLYALLVDRKNFARWIGWFAASLDGLFLTKTFRPLFR